MKIKGNQKNFEPCPEHNGRGVCVDVTPTENKQTQYGPRDIFRIVFETDKLREDGTPYAVWSKGFTASLNEKASLRKFLRGWFGRDLTPQEMEDFDTETLLGKPAMLVVVHEIVENETYANIAACTPDRSDNPLKPSGKFVRKQDRDKNTNGKPDADYKKVEQPAKAEETSEVDHSRVKVHVGKCAGIELRDLAPEQIQPLIDKWMPVVLNAPKLTADDKRLLAALEWWDGKQKEKKADDVPY